MKYELMTIYKNDLGEEGAQNLSSKIKEIIESMDGKEIQNDFWGRRKFAYEIEHNNEGFYDVFTFDFESCSFFNFLNLKSISLICFLFVRTT